MAYIYKITNDINNKVYIGKTQFSIEKRFWEHCRDSKKRKNEKRPLYSAMNKYGIEHFHIELVEETSNPEEREKYWIKQYNSFHNGYNATLGGDGKQYLDYDKIIKTYQKLQSVRETAKKLKIDAGYAGQILKANNQLVPTASQAAQLKNGKPVNQYDLNGNFLRTFPSAKAAASALGKITSTSNGASSHITNVCKGKGKSAYGYKWKFANQ